VRVKKSQARAPNASMVQLMQPDSQWSDPVGQLVSLQAAREVLLARSLNPSERFDRATSLLVKYRASEFPESMRPRYERIMQARLAVRRDYTGVTVFEFSRLSARNRRALQKDVIALYEACLLDIGKMSGTSAGADREFYDIVYPCEEERQPLVKRTRRRRSKNSWSR
jgi:hypothetical protein